VQTCCYTFQLLETRNENNEIVSSAQLSHVEDDPVYFAVAADLAAVLFLKICLLEDTRSDLLFQEFPSPK
jgi:hypothetical protein